MIEIINHKLYEIEEKYNVKVLYACETGSRAWGFPSPDSDYDVRFVFAFKDYLTINEPRDVIEFQVDETWDITGWDLKKSLRLFRGTNSAMLERLNSPIVYKEISGFRTKLLKETPQYFAPKAAMHHYLSMTHNIFTQDLQSESVRLKKYFYAIRTSLAALWIAHNQSVPPMTLGELRVNLPQNLAPIIDEMISLKMRSNEKTLVAKYVDVHDFIQKSIDFCTSVAPTLRVNRDSDDATLNQLFKEFIPQ